MYIFYILLTFVPHSPIPMKHTPYTPISVPEQIEVGPHQGKFAVRYRDENGLVQTHFPFYTSQIAWAFSISRHHKHFKIPLVPIPIGDLKPGDLVLDQHYQLVQIIASARSRRNLFNEVLYRAEGVFASDLPKPGIEFLIGNAFKLPLENEDFVI